MKKLFQTLFIILAIVAGGAVIVRFVTSQKKTEQSVAYYTCPMHHQIHMDHPGSCPICGMTLIPVLKEGGQQKSDQEKPSGVYVSPERQQLIGVKTEEVSLRLLNKTIHTSGRIAFDPELASAQQEYLEALHMKNKAAAADDSGLQERTNTFVESTRSRLMLLGMDEAWIKELSKQGSAQKNLYQPGQKSILVSAVIYETEVPLVKAGMPAIIFVQGEPQKRLEGKVKSVASLIDPQTRSAKTYIEAPADPMLKPDTYVQAEIQVPLGEMLAVPKTAVLQNGNQKIVLVVKEDNYFSPKEISVVTEGDDAFGIDAGLEAGERVVTSANFLIDSESQLRAVLSEVNLH